MRAAIARSSSRLPSPTMARMPVMRGGPIARSALRRGRLSAAGRGETGYTALGRTCMADSRRGLNRRSRMVTEGDERSPNRAMLRAVGFRDEDFGKPIVGVANGQSDLTPCNAGLGDLAALAAGAIRAAGAMPQTFGTITISH